MIDLRGRTALVTGGGRGIGAGITRVLARAGADVAIIYQYDADAAAAVADDVRAVGKRVAVIQADLRVHEQCVAAARDATDQLGAIDILVHNAGTGPRGKTAVETEPAEFESLLGVHCFGGVSLAQALVPAMRERARGDVIFVTAAIPAGGTPNVAPYAMAKAAAEAFAHTLAQEERSQGIRVNVVRPGFTESDMASGLLRRMTGDTDFRKWDAVSPFGRVEQPEDVGNIVAFLASEAGGYITNQVINVDGGQATFFGGRLPFDLSW